MLGANDEIFDYVKDYMRVLLYFGPIYVLIDTLCCFVRNDKVSKLSMHAMIIGAIINGFLDYIFIFKFHWGVSGAALATGMGNILSIMLLLAHFVLKKGEIKFVKTQVILNDYNKNH